jgi:hypothetical protein
VRRHSGARFVIGVAVSGADGALHDAEKLFAQTDSDDQPAWLSYFDTAYLAAKFGHVFLDMGQPAEAE